MILLAACGDSSDSNNNETNNNNGNNNDNTEENVNDSDASGDLVVYNARDQEVVDKVTEMFNEKYPDVNLEVLTMGAQEIMERVRGEQSNPGGDFWWGGTQSAFMRSEEHTSELQSRGHLVCRLLLEKKN